MNIYTVTLTEDEREALYELTSKGKHDSQKILNALILLSCDKSEWNVNHSTNEEISRVLNISMRKIDRVKKRFVEEGLEVALNGKKRNRIYDKKVDGDLEAHLVALSCSEPPEGFARWSLRLLADQVVELGYTDNISHETVRRTLKKRNQTLAKERMVIPPEQNSSLSDKRKRSPAFPLLGTVLESFPSYGSSVFKPFRIGHQLF